MAVCYYTFIKSFVKQNSLQQQQQEQDCQIIMIIQCTGVVWLVSPAAIVLSTFHTNVAIYKLTAWGIHIMYNRHKNTRGDSIGGFTGF